VRAGSFTVPRALAWVTTSVGLIGAGLIGAGLCGVGLALAGASSPLRAPLVLLFLATAPLLAVAGLLRGIDPFARILVACAAMVVIDAGVAETMLAAGWWSPRGGLIAIMTISAVLGLVQLPAAVVRAAARHLERRLGHPVERT
jgi:hypothetical protein